LLYQITKGKRHTKEELKIKKLMVVLVMLVGLGQAGCVFIGGAGLGAGATGVGYEYNAYRQMQQGKEDYKDEKISRAEYRRA